MLRSLTALLIALWCFTACTSSDHRATNSVPPPVQDSVPAPAPPVRDTLTTLIPGSYLESVTNSGQAYILYIPRSFRDSLPMPLMVCFDPQGNGRVPVHRYASLADEFGFILAGSNQVRNGLGIDASASMARELAAAVLEKMKTTHAGLFLCGFSGGAKVALVAPGNMKGVSGVVHCGAGLPDGIPAPTVPTYGVTGNRDMNYSEVIEFVNRLGRQPMHHLDITDGKHAWPETTDMRRAFSWCKVLACKSGGNCERPVLQQFTRQINTLAARTTDPIQRMRIYRCGIDCLQGLSPVPEWENSVQRLMKDPVYQQSILEDSRALSAELNRRQFLLDAFRSQEEDWWSHVIGDLQKRKQDPMNDRLLGYISLACYSLTRQAMEQGNMPEVARLNRIYLLADPENAEPNFLAAKLFSQVGQKDSVLSYLKRSVQYGFKDLSRLESETAIRALLSPADQRELEEGIRKNQSDW